MILRTHLKSWVRSLLLTLAATTACPFLFAPSQGRPNPFAALPVLYRSSTPAQQRRKLYPVDEAAKDPSFKAFRDTLIDAVNRKDTQLILKSIAPNIENGFGGENGIKEFKVIWELANGAQSDLWDELDGILSMGGTFQVDEGKKLFCAPYVYSAWPDDFECDDGTMCYAVVGEQVNVRREPRSDAPVITSLSYDIVETYLENEALAAKHAGWAKIKIAGGGSGYVMDKYLRSPYDYRACFGKVKGKWLMTALVAGD